MELFHYYSEYRVIVCKSCQYAIQPGRITAHLRSDQHKLTRWQSEEAAEQYKSYDLADPCIEIVMPNSIVTPIDYLPLHKDGLQCNQCSYICRAVEVMKRHQRDTHNMRIGRGRRLAAISWTSTWCQCFFTSAGQRYFPVQQPNEATDPAPSTTDRLIRLVHR